MLGVGDWTVRMGDVEATAALRGETDDVGEAVLRPPGWRTDVVLAERTDLTAEVILQGIGAVALVAEPTPTPDDEAIEAAVLAARGAQVAVVVVRVTGNRRRGRRQVDTGAPRPAGRPGLRSPRPPSGPWSCSTRPLPS